MKKSLITLSLSILLTLGATQISYANAIDEDVSIGLESDILHSKLQDIYKNNTTDEDREKALRSLIDSMNDKYSEYLSKDTLDKFKQTLNNDKHRLGVVVFENEYKNVEVQSVVTGSIAEGLGILVGDEVLTINNVKVTRANIKELVQNTNKNDKLSLSIKRDESTILMATSIQSHYAAAYKNISDLIDLDKTNSTIGYIDINIINDKTYDEFKKAMDTALKNKNDKIILDLRGNVGGILEETIKIAQQFIPKGPIAYLKNTNGERIEYKSELETLPFKQIAVLTDKNTASGSEIISSAVKESGIGITVGTNTYGKGTAQEVIPLGNGDFIKVTTDEFFSRNGNKVNEIGVKPDILVEPMSLLNEHTKLDYSLNDTFEKLGYVSIGIKTREKAIQDIKNAIKKIKTENNLANNDILDIDTINIINQNIYNYIVNVDSVLIEAYNYLNK